MPNLPEQDPHPPETPDYYGATLYFPDCRIFRGHYLRISRTTQQYLREALIAELEKHARLHRAAKSQPCLPHGELNDIYRTLVSERKREPQWSTSGTFETAWNEEGATYDLTLMHGAF